MTYYAGTNQGGKQKGKQNGDKHATHTEDCALKKKKKPEKRKKKQATRGLKQKKNRGKNFSE